MSVLGDMQSARSDIDQLLGEDPFATDIYGTSIPYTPSDVGELVWADCADSYWANVIKEMGAGGVIDKFPSLFDKQDRLLNSSEMEQLSESDHFATIEMTRGLQKAFDAMNSGSVEGPHGGPVMSPEANAAFWDGLDRFAQFADVASNTRSRWEVFKEALSNNIDDLAEGVGRAAAVAGQTVGRALGAAGAGFFGELGVINTVIVLGAGVIAYRVIF